MIDNIELISIFNPETYNTVKTLPQFKKTMKRKIDLNKDIKYIHKKYNSINLLDYYIRTKETTRGINVVAYSNVITTIMMGAYLNKNFSIEVIKDRKIIYLNSTEDLNTNEMLMNNYKRQELYKNTVLTSNKNIRYGLSKVKLGDYTLLVAGKIDASIFKNHINIIIAKKLTYKLLLEIYINGIITKTYKVLYGLLNKDNNIRYLNALKISEIEDFLSLDVNKGQRFFNKVMKKTTESKKHKFILSYNANKGEFLIN